MIFNVADIKKTDYVELLEPSKWVEGALEDLGCKGKLDLRVQLTPAGDKVWMNGEVKGCKVFECHGCGTPLEGDFQLPIKLLIEFSEKPGIHWLDDEVENYDDYIVQLGPEVTEFSLEHLIREQLLLNCATTRSDNYLESKPCKICKENEKLLNLGSEEKSIDPRWDKLKDLLK